MMAYKNVIQVNIKSKTLYQSAFNVRYHVILYNQGETQLKIVTSQSGRQLLNCIRLIINLSANTKNILKHPNFLTAKVADVF